MFLSDLLNVKFNFGSNDYLVNCEDIVNNKNRKVRLKFARENANWLVKKTKFGLWITLVS